MLVLLLISACANSPCQDEVVYVGWANPYATCSWPDAEMTLVQTPDGSSFMECRCAPFHLNESDLEGLRKH